jgi:putative FmdB family regulatory protein
MPIYSYECQECRHQFDLWEKMEEVNPNRACPECASGRVKKILAPFRTHGWSSFLDQMERKISPHKFK